MATHKPQQQVCDGVRHMHEAQQQQHNNTAPQQHSATTTGVRRRAPHARGTRDAPRYQAGQRLPRRERIGKTLIFHMYLLLLARLLLAF